MNILTFDIEDWFHILDNPSTAHIKDWDQFNSRVEESTAVLLDILEKRKQKATFFILGWTAEKHPSMVKQITEAGHEIGTHSYGHQLVYQQTPDQFSSDLERSLDILQDISGHPVEYYRSPGFSITSSTPWAFEILVEHGIKIDCSIFPANRAHGGYLGFSDQPSLIMTPSGPLRELPMNIGNFFGLDIAFSGGGYFRILPYCFIKYQIKRSDYVMTYFHPRDFDTHQPVIKGLPLMRRFKSYIGISSALRKLNRMIYDFGFLDITSANSLINWKNVPRVRI